jgi:hypothetical protein
VIVVVGQPLYRVTEEEPGVDGLAARVARDPGRTRS